MRFFSFVSGGNYSCFFFDWKLATIKRFRNRLSHVVFFLNSQHSSKKRSFVDVSLENLNKNSSICVQFLQATPLFYYATRGMQGIHQSSSSRLESVGDEQKWIRIQPNLNTALGLKKNVDFQRVLTHIFILRGMYNSTWINCWPKLDKAKSQECRQDIIIIQESSKVKVKSLENRNRATWRDSSAFEHELLHYFFLNTKNCSANFDIVCTFEQSSCALGNVSFSRGLKSSRVASKSARFYQRPS